MSEYIERGALLKYICNSCDGWCENTNCDCVNCKSEHRCDIVQEITDVPAADVVEVKHGEWIHDTNNLYGCSECMERETMSPKKLKPYCPNCGAKMDGDGK